MAAGPGTLKLLAGAGTLVLAGGATAAVLADARRAGAPLKPPVEGGGAGARASTTPGPGGDALAIPVTPVCGGAGAGASGGAGPGAAGTGGMPRATLDPAVRTALQQLQGASAPRRSEVLATLTADQRQQLTAALALAARAHGNRAGAGFGCRGAGDSAGPSGGEVSPVSSGDGQATPVTVSGVS